jgi:uncharacterized membrane protein (DUF373 family)
MSDHQAGVSEKDDTSSPSQQNNSSSHEPENALATISGNILDRSDTLIYAIVGACFFLGALFTLGYSFWDFGSTLTQIPALVAAANASKDLQEPVTQQSIVAGAIIKFISDLLLVLIIMEVLSTVIHYLKAHATSLRPFLFIGIISATRGILSIGARLSVQKVALPSPEFTSDMIELGVNAVVILALGFTLKLLGKLVEQ